MRALVQRVTSASVTIESHGEGSASDEVSVENDPRVHSEADTEADGHNTVTSIDQGYVIFLGVGQEDTETQAETLWSKISKLRIFEDENGKTNLSLADIQGEVLVVSQFTLFANCKKGNRPSFVDAGAPDDANRLYEYFVSLARSAVPRVETGVFGAMMDVHLVNNGPFTIWLDTDTL